MSDSEKKYSISKKDVEPYYTNSLQEDGRYLGYKKKDPLDEFLEEAQKQAKLSHPEKKAPEKPKSPPIDPRITEINKLYHLLDLRKTEFKKASRIRWILAFVGFVLVFCFVLIKGDIKSLFEADVIGIFWMLVVAAMLTGFYFFVNVSIFGWLFQKDIADKRRLDNIQQQINELEKNLNK